MSVVNNSEYSKGLGHVNDVVDAHILWMGANIEITCSDCGAILSVVKHKTNTDKGHYIKVERCTCKDK